MLNKLVNFIVDNTNRFPVIILLMLSATVVILGDYFAKQWSVGRNNIFFILGVIAYGMSAFFYIPTLLREGLVVTSITWSIMSIVGFLFVGLLIFKESLTSLQWIGVGFGILSLIILSIADH